MWLLKTEPGTYSYEDLEKEGGTRWQADSGQYLLAFEGDPSAGELRVVERKPPVPRAAPDSWEDWFAQGAALERDDPEQAARAYRGAIEDVIQDAVRFLLRALGVTQAAIDAYYRPEALNEKCPAPVVPAAASAAE